MTMSKKTVRSTRTSTHTNQPTSKILPLRQPNAAAVNERKRKVVSVEDATTSKVTKIRKHNQQQAQSAPSTNQRVVKEVVQPHKGPQSQQTALNHVKDRCLNIYVFGQNGDGQLGLGATDVPLEVPRPRFNPRLSADTVGVTQIAVGAMHCVALTRDNKILTWGVNDLGALGRDTKWDGRMVDIDEKDAEDNERETTPDLNPLEAFPAQIDPSTFPNATRFVQVIAGDSASFALTDDGLVYGWGTFRGNDGVIGFSPGTNIQSTPTRIPGLAQVVQLASGDNHVLALTSKGAVYSWGAGEQCQLGRRLIMRTKVHGLLPRQFGLSKGIVRVGAGADHSFAVHQNGTVYGWGSNNYGQTGSFSDMGEDSAVVLHPTIIESLNESGEGKVVSVDGGRHHSIAVTDKGACLTWGRVDNYSTGLQIQTLPADAVLNDERGNPRILKKATKIPGIHAVLAVASSDHCIAITADGKAYSWGFSSEYQTGQGTDEDVETATLMKSKAIQGKKLVWAGAGAQFGMVGEDVYSILPNGT